MATYNPLPLNLQGGPSGAGPDFMKPWPIHGRAPQKQPTLGSKWPVEVGALYPYAMNPYMGYEPGSLLNPKP